MLGLQSNHDTAQDFPIMQSTLSVKQARGYDWDVTKTHTNNYTMKGIFLTVFLIFFCIIKVLTQAYLCQAVSVTWVHWYKKKTSPLNPLNIYKLGHHCACRCPCNKRYQVIRGHVVIIIINKEHLFLQFYRLLMIPNMLTYDSFSPGRSGRNFKTAIFNLALLIDIFRSCDNSPHMNGTGLNWREVNTGSGNGLVPSGNKPLPEPMWSKFYDAIWCH